MSAPAVARDPARRRWPQRVALTATFLFIATASLAAQNAAGTPSLAMYEYAQAQRERAESLVAGGRSDEALAVLQATIDSLHTPASLLLAQGWAPLKSREANVEYDVMLIHLTRGDTTAAIAAFERLVRAGGTAGYLQFLGQDSTRLPALRRHPAFAQLELELSRTRDRWSNVAFDGRWEATLSRAERVAGLSVVWAEARYGYIDFRRIPELDWDSLYVATIDAAIEAPDTWEYYKVMRRFIAQLRDSHTNLILPRAVIDSLWTRPAMETRKVEGEVIVFGVADAGITALGVRPGDRILAIDGIPVERYVADSVDPFVAWATPQDRAVRAYHYELLRGPRDRPVRLTLSTNNGPVRDVTVPRQRIGPVESTPVVTATRVDGDLALVAVRSMNDMAYVAQFDSALASLGEVRGVIIDVRDNGGGNSGVGYRILARFLDATSPGSNWEGMSYSALQRARSGWGNRPDHGTPSMIEPDTARHLDLPVAVLIGPKTFSAAEDFAVAADQAGVPLIGLPTGGSTGQPMSFRLPAGVLARIRAKHDTYADGRAFVGVGVQPTIRVPETLADVRAGRDAALTAAVEWMQAKR